MTFKSASSNYWRICTSKICSSAQKSLKPCTIISSTWKSTMPYCIVIKTAPSINTAKSTLPVCLHINFAILNRYSRFQWIEKWKRVKEYLAFSTIFICNSTQAEGNKTSHAQEAVAQITLSCVVLQCKDPTHPNVDAEPRPTYATYLTNPGQNKMYRTAWVKNTSQNHWKCRCHSGIPEVTANW